ncbi:hypothetical protein CLIB1444_24S00342 [[Candida] jaroonii]|uniref:Uncharacterized protein n=1 Tax=[Candida] jaroonii TaxID=467808 RepID=A0ACA9YG65_9ASCO|nr:hypothetical protein CLIB1444_24S00342 [[Candida] jaroonii]
MRILIDFDETITTKDTISLLLSLPQHHLQPSHFSDIYLSAYKSHVKSVANVEDEINFQKQLLSVENTSINALQHEKFFKGITANQIARLSSEVAVQPGFFTFLRKCKTLNLAVSILSLNWSSVLIRSVLGEFGNDVEIVCNDLEMVDGVCTGNFKGNIRTGYDKLQYIRQFPQKVYIGDSRSDLLSLLASDVGIVMESGSLLKKSPWELKIKSLNEIRFVDKFTHRKVNEFTNREVDKCTNRKVNEFSNQLYKANWHDIVEFI